MTGTTAPGTRTSTDFDFLTGSFDVVHRQLTAPLTGSTEWYTHTGTCVARRALDGDVSIDEMQFPAKGRYGMSVRLFDRTAREWAIYWVDSRTGTLQPPVRGGWSGGACELVGEDAYECRPILARYRWSEVREATAHWEQAFSTDGGATWETNWLMDFTRRVDAPPPLPLPKTTGDFDVLTGGWDAVRPDAPLPGTRSGTRVSLHAWTQFDGAVSIEEGEDGLMIRLYEPQERRWSLNWVDRAAGVLTAPYLGAFGADGLGVFDRTDTREGRPVLVRRRWTPPRAGQPPMWEQLVSADGGVTWEQEWRTVLTRRPSGGPGTPRP